MDDLSRAHADALYAVEQLRAFISEYDQFAHTLPPDSSVLKQLERARETVAAFDAVDKALGNRLSFPA
ncbi:MAG: hypothetical protein JO186_11420 [Actinobacteria bacterium]|nr:hypothetical protein [Actinomycetota bacterium]MBV8395088.1 hypothetical protein [Actinomycetota bacterium]MBV8598584.1 hypothetical protein [Actinomycetota bacterium]